MTKSKYGVYIGIILVIALVALVLFLADSEPTEPVEPDENIADWQMYENEEFGFSLRYPEGWAVAEDTDSSITPLISVYRPDDAFNEPPFDHHSSETHVSVYPQGIPTEGFFGETATATVSFSVPINRADNYVLADGTDFATYINVEVMSRGWNESGFLFAHTEIDDLETECRREGEVIPEEQCDVLFGDTVVRYGEIDEDIRDKQVQILESFQLTN